MGDPLGTARRSDLSCVSWRKSSHSAGQAECVEVTDLDGAVAVRDSKNPSGPALVFGADEWRAFVRGARAGEFDRP